LVGAAHRAQQNLVEQRQFSINVAMSSRRRSRAFPPKPWRKTTKRFCISRGKVNTLASEADGSLTTQGADRGPAQADAGILGAYQRVSATSEKSRVESYSMLREQLASRGNSADTGCANFAAVTALRRPQTRGQWGEITLRRLVELAA